MRVRLGRTGIEVNADGFGGLPLQRATYGDAMDILRAAMDGGIDFFDTARMYTDSEEKLGAVLAERKEHIVMATKTMAREPAAIREELETSLRNLRLEAVDIYQLHNPAFCPLPGDGSGVYEELEKFKKEGKVRFIGFTNHRADVARQAVESGLYDTLQFPFCYLSGEVEKDLVRLCAEKDVGFIAMKALSGGLITNLAAARGWMAEWPTVLPIWGIQRRGELDELLQLQRGPAALTDSLREAIERDQAELQGEFCRGCGYCGPCPAGIQIHMCARMSLLLRRAPTKNYTTEHWRAEMAKTQDCIHCGQCAEKCPYGLDPEALLEKNYQDFLTFI